MTDEEKRNMMNKKVRDIALKIQDKRYQRAEKKANSLMKKIGACTRIMNDAAIKREKISKEWRGGL